MLLLDGGSNISKTSEFVPVENINSAPRKEIITVDAVDVDMQDSMSITVPIVVVVLIVILLVTIGTVLGVLIGLRRRKGKAVTTITDPTR